MRLRENGAGKSAPDVPRRRACDRRHHVTVQIGGGFRDAPRVRRKAAALPRIGADRCDRSRSIDRDAGLVIGRSTPPSASAARNDASAATTSPARGEQPTPASTGIPRWIAKTSTSCAKVQPLPSGPARTATSRRRIRRPRSSGPMRATDGVSADRRGVNIRIPVTLRSGPSGRTGPLNGQVRLDRVARLVVKLSVFHTTSEGVRRGGLPRQDVAGSRRARSARGPTGTETADNTPPEDDVEVAHRHVKRPPTNRSTPCCSRSREPIQASAAAGERDRVIEVHEATADQRVDADRALTASSATAAASRPDRTRRTPVGDDVRRDPALDGSAAHRGARRPDAPSRRTRRGKNEKRS